MRSLTARPQPWTLLPLLLSLLAATALALLVTAPPALAHNTLLSSSPEDGDSLDSVPEEVTLTFSDEVLDGGNAIVVTGPGGDDHASGEVRVDSEVASIDLSSLEEPGEYTIAYRIVSADGHVIEDTLSFSLTEEAVAQADAVETENADEEASAVEQPATDTESPAATEAQDPLVSNPVLGVVLALGVIGIIVVLIIRLRRHDWSGKDRGDNAGG